MAKHVYMSSKQLNLEENFLKLRIGTTRFRMRKDILFRKSSYFKRRYENNPSVDEVVIIGIKVESMEAIMDFIFHHKITIRECNFKEIVTVGKLFEIRELSELPENSGGFVAHMTVPQPEIHIFDIMVAVPANPPPPTSPPIQLATTASGLRIPYDPDVARRYIEEFCQSVANEKLAQKPSSG